MKRAVAAGMPRLVRLFGGGTPSLLTRSSCGVWWLRSPVARSGVTVECNPETVDGPKLQAIEMRRDRLSFGVQPMAPHSWRPGASA